MSFRFNKTFMASFISPFGLERRLKVFSNRDECETLKEGILFQASDSLENGISTFFLGRPYAEAYMIKALSGLVKAWAKKAGVSPKLVPASNSETTIIAAFLPEKDVERFLSVIDSDFAKKFHDILPVPQKDMGYPVEFNLSYESVMVEKLKYEKEFTLEMRVNHTGKNAVAVLGKGRVASGEDPDLCAGASYAIAQAGVRTIGEKETKKVLRKADLARELAIARTVTAAAIGGGGVLLLLHAGAEAMDMENFKMAIEWVSIGFAVVLASNLFHPKYLLPIQAKKAVSETVENKLA